MRKTFYGVRAALEEMAQKDMDKLLKALKKKLSDEGGAAGFKPLKDIAKTMGVDLTPAMLKSMDGIMQHRDGDYILEELEEGIFDKAKQGISKLKSMTPAAKAAKRAERERKAMDNMTNSIVALGMAKRGKPKKEAVKYPHMMYDPKTGKEVTAKTPEDHDKFAKMGYTHEKPKMDEIVTSADKKPQNVVGPDGKTRVRMVPVTKRSEPREAMDPVDPKAVKKDFKDRKDKDIDNDGDVDDSDKYLHKKRKAISKSVNKNEDEPDGDNGETAVMNPKKESKATKESTIRERLMSIWEKADRDKHYKGATEPEPMTKDDERSAKKMKDGHKNVKRDDHIDKETSVDAEKAGPSTKYRGNDNQSGDKNIIPSATKDNPANKVKKESVMTDKKEEYGVFGQKISSSMLKAYSMVEGFTHEFDYAESGRNTAKSFVAKAKSAGIKAKIHSPSGPGGGHPVVHLGHKDTKHMHSFLKKHYDPGMHHDDLHDYKISSTKSEAVQTESFTHEFDYAERRGNTAKNFVAKAKEAGIKAKIHSPSGPGGHPVVHLGHKDTKHMHGFLKKHYDPGMHHDDLHDYKI
tara:strand:- start:10416 stop:12143 length:1728 start_codon:yes stop_codon:yes gene_type:complete